jgi:hypothetical protein
MEALHVKIIADGAFDAARGRFVMTKAGPFTATLEEFETEDATLKKNANDLEAQAKQNTASLQNGKLTKREYDALKNQLAKGDRDLHGQLVSFKKKYASVRWIYSTIEGKPAFRRDDYQEGFVKGSTRIMAEFPKVLEGGGTAYVEAFFYDPIPDPEDKTGKTTKKLKPKNSPPYGCFISATGQPDVVAAEWRDAKGNLIKEKVAYGSTVYLHLYTNALYGNEIKVRLKDTHRTNANLPPTEHDQDDQPIESLSPDPDAADKFFSRKVKIYHYPKGDPHNNLPSKAVTGMLGNAHTKDNELDLNIQKCVIAVFIEPRWQFDGADSNRNTRTDDGSTLEIHPIVYHPRLVNGSRAMSSCKLTVSKNEATYKEKALKGNSVVVISDGAAKERQKEDGKERKDFTIGVFIDGTANNRYNSQARIQWEKMRLHEPQEVYNDADHLRIYAKSEDEVEGTKKFTVQGTPYEYKYGEGSYENDPTNTAILFDHYKKNKTTFKVYTEGIGTQTLGHEENGIWVVDSYEGDANRGLALGGGSSGIIARVKRAIEQTSKMIKENLKADQAIGTLTIDIFGFSRGAAAARNFVDEVMLREYFATGLKDRNGNDVDAAFAIEGKFPKHGWLGYKLTEKNITIDSLIVRFAGLYDTVAHFGYSQSDDIQELGLNSIAKAKHVVHMTANDEIRANFSLSRIPRGPNHIELNLPGVHSDVGGCYIEGRPEGVPFAKNGPSDPNGYHFILRTTNQRKLESDKNRLVEAGWYTEDQIQIFPLRNGAGELRSYRPYISNQYSFIPLHLMCKYALQIEVPFTMNTLTKAKNFTNNPISGNVKFLNTIKSRLDAYANNVFASPTGNVSCTFELEDLKKLRNNYLHYNAVVGDALNVNAPTTGGKRDEVKP